MTVLIPSSAILRYDLSLRRDDWDQIANQNKFIGLQVFPAAPVAKPSSNFTRLSIGSTMVPQRTLTRNPRGAYARDEWGWTTDSYQTQEHGVEAPVDDAEIELYGDYLPIEQISSQRVASLLMAEHEAACATQLFNSSAYTSNQTIALSVGTTSFQDVGTNDPITVIKTAIWQCRKYGVRANAMVIPQIAFDWLTLSQAIINRIKYSGQDDPKEVTVNMIKALTGLEHILIGDSFENTANFGNTPSIGRFWNPTMTWIGRIADASSQLTYPGVCVGRTVMYTGQNASIPGIGEQSTEPAIIMEEYREEQRRGGVIRGRWNWQLKPFDDPMADGNFYRAGVLLTSVTDGTKI